MYLKLDYKPIVQLVSLSVFGVSYAQSHVLPGPTTISISIYLFV